MKSKLLFTAALALVGVCSAQTPSPTASQSSWQLGPPFQAGSPRTSSTPAVAVSPVPTSTGPAAIASPTARGRDSSTGKTPYVEGSVWIMTFVKTKSGSSDEYLKSLSSSLKPIYEEEKKQKVILDYKILTAEAAGDRDFDILIMVEYPNMAAVEGAREKTEPIIEKIIGPADKRRDVAAKRLDLREILATKTMREIWLK
jgi:hypothetical protein